MSHGRRETSLFPALLYESGLEPSLATTHAKAFTPCERDPLGLVKRRGGSRHTCSAMRSPWETRALSRYESGLKPSLATTRAKAFAPCERDPLGQGEDGTREGPENVLFPASRKKRISELGVKGTF